MQLDTASTTVEVAAWPTRGRGNHMGGEQMSRPGADVHRAARPSRPSPFVDGAAVSVGSLPHNDAVAAAAFSIAEFDIATIPSLPKRSTAESMVAQALSGIPGVGFDPDGDRKSTRLNSSHSGESRMPSSA